MESLNLDCIEHIMTFLILRDKINYALTGTQFREAFRQWAKRHLKIVDKELLHDLSEDEIKLLIRLAGDAIEYFDMRKDLLPEISECCTNLKHISIERHHDQQFESQIALLAKLKTLVSVKYETVCTDNTMLEELMQALKQLPKLCSLCLFCEYFRGQYLSELKHIENLALYECKNIEHVHFEAFCSSMKNLRNLYLHGQYEGNYKMSVAMYKAMIQHCENLENLWLSHIIGPYELVADLPKLTRLFIFNEDLAIRSKLFPALAAKKADQLLCLKLCGKVVSENSSECIGRLKELQELQCSLDNINCLEKFKDLKKLEYLYLECPNFVDRDALRIIRMFSSLFFFGTGSTNLTEDFVLDIIKVLRNEQENGHRKYAKLIIGADGPLQKALKNPLYLNSREYIQILGVFTGLSKCTTMDDVYYDNMYFLHHMK